MAVDIRHAARITDALALAHPGELGFAVDWLPPENGLWTRWSRYTSGQCSGTRWPVACRADFGVVALNKVRQATSLALAAAACCVRDGGALYLFGQNDLGIRSFSRFRDAGFDTVDVGAHGRLLRWCGRVEAAVEGLEDFRSVRPLEVPSVGRVDWVDYPGCFADGRLDAGTALLLASLEDEPAVDGLVYDFACGPGAISRSVSGRWPGVTVFGSDTDAIAVHAARQNVPACEFAVADGWALSVGEAPKLVLSNPPFHFGKDRDHAICFNFIERARQGLATDGELRMVVQREVAVEPELRSAFRQVRCVIASGGYVVWAARSPIRTAARP